MKLSPTKCAAILIAVSTAIICRETQARPAVGSIDFGGVVTFDTLSLATATRVNTWNSSFVLQDFGDFSTISPGTSVTMAPQWIFNPSTPTPGLWSVGGFTFDLTSSTIVRQNANFLNVTGLGTISGNSFDPTPGVWSFSSSSSNGSTSTTFGFQSTTQAVPEPGTVAFLVVASTAAVLLRQLQRVRARLKVAANQTSPIL